MVYDVHYVRLQNCSILLFIYALFFLCMHLLFAVPNTQCFYFSTFILTIGLFILQLTLSLLELRTFQEPEVMQRCVMPVTSSPPSGDSLPLEKDELSAFKAGLRKVKILSDFISTRKVKKMCRDDEGSEGKCSTRSEDGEYAYPFDSDSLDDDDADEVEEGDSSFRKSFSYGTLASANFYGGPVCSDLSIKGDYEEWIPYSHRRSDVGLSNLDQATKPISDQPLRQTSKRSILNWKKRKLSFRLPKAKGEPLLKKGNGDEGGDDIDFDRRQLTSSDESYNVGFFLFSFVYL